MTSIMRGIEVGWLRKFWTLQDQAEAGRFASVFVGGNVTKGTGWDLVIPSVFQASCGPNPLVIPSASEGSRFLLVRPVSRAGKHLDPSLALGMTVVRGECRGCETGLAGRNHIFQFDDGSFQFADQGA